MFQKSIRRTAPLPGHSNPKFVPAVATVTVTDWLALPLAPLQVSVKVLVMVSTPLDWLPETALAPDQPPEAVQEVALVDDQVSVDDPPLAIDVGFAVSATVGTGGGGDTVVKFQSKLAALTDKEIIQVRRMNVKRTEFFHRCWLTRHIERK